MKKNESRKVSGRIVVVSDDYVTVMVSENEPSYRSGQHIIVSIPYERKTALGKVVSVAEIVAKGEISDITDSVVTIQSRRASPLISQSALRDRFGKESIMFVL